MNEQSIYWGGGWEEYPYFLLPHTCTTEAEAQLESNEFIGALSSLELNFIYLLCRDEEILE